MSERDYNVYSIVLKLDFEIEIVKFDLEYVKKKSHKLAKKILQLQNYNKYEFLGLPVNTYSSRMKIDRAKFEGKNHYTMYNCCLLYTSGRWDADKSLFYFLEKICVKYCLFNT